MKSLKYLVLFSVLFSGLQSFALFEARLTYGNLANRPDFGDLSGQGSSPDPLPSTGIGADAILTLPIPLIPGFGLRYENMGYNVSGGGTEIKGNHARTAALVNWRILDNVVFLGPLFTYGLSHSNNTKVRTSTMERDWKADTVSSYQLGLEGGVTLINYVVGAELGYQSMKFDNASDQMGTTTQKKSIDMSGTYFKVMLGFSI